VSAAQESFQLHDDELDQGDIFSNIPFVKWHEGEPAIGGGARGVVTSHGCTCEDYQRRLDLGHTQAAAKVMIQVAPLRPATSFPLQQRSAIADGDYFDYFLVYGQRGVLGDQVADLTKEQSIPASVVMTCDKIARLAPWQWNRLLVHIAVSRFHQKPETIFRPDILESPDEA
jgi:hypothetical protein